MYSKLSVQFSVPKCNLLVNSGIYFDLVQAIFFPHVLVLLLA